MKKRLTLILVGMLLSIGSILAQNKISGTVFDQDMGEPLMGATVKVQGSSKGVTTDMNGKFTIDVPAGKKLVISFVGMNTQTVTPKQGMKVNLTSNTAQVGEVVVTGIQKMDKRLFTGATTKIDAEQTKLDGVADVTR
ncbi:MAG: carboxypeptidase-like regulatory domain-containing protein, partial [Prevotella sp.]|nr:carboxypeptidase-like regulatory domain-containing protein [Prevotella sp.]